MIKLKSNQLAMWHPHELSSDEVEFIIRKVNAVKFINEQEKFYKRNFTKEDEKRYQFLRKELKMLQNLKIKLDVWTK